jgi:hypothetical protein
MQGHSGLLVVVGGMLVIVAAFAVLALVLAP